MKKKLSFKKKTISLIDGNEAQNIKGGSLVCLTIRDSERVCFTGNTSHNGQVCTGTGGGTLAYCGTGPCTSSPCGGTNGCTGVGCNSVQYTHCNC